jgi:hypothetical protein
MAKKLVLIRGARWSTPAERGTYGGGYEYDDTVRLQQSAGQGHRQDRDSTNDSSSTCLRPFIDKFVAERKRIGAERCEFVFDAHTSNASKELKVVLFHLWRVNVKATGGFIYILLEDSWIKPHYNNFKKCTSSYIPFSDATVARSTIYSSTIISSIHAPLFPGALIKQNAFTRMQVCILVFLTAQQDNEVILVGKSVSNLYLLYCMFLCKPALPVLFSASKISS